MRAYILSIDGTFYESPQSFEYNRWAELAPWLNISERQGR